MAWAAAVGSRRFFPGEELECFRLAGGSAHEGSDGTAEDARGGVGVELVVHRLFRGLVAREFRDLAAAPVEDGEGVAIEPTTETLAAVVERDAFDAEFPAEVDFPPWLIGVLVRVGLAIAEVTGVLVAVDGAGSDAFESGILLRSLARTGDILSPAHDFHFGEGQRAIAGEFDADVAAERAFDARGFLLNGRRQLGEETADARIGCRAQRSVLQQRDRTKVIAQGRRRLLSLVPCGFDRSLGHNECGETCLAGRRRHGGRREGREPFADGLEVG
jgi:hypothetical protein